VSPEAIYRYEVPIDGDWHTLPLSGAVLHVDCRAPGTVELWALRSGGPELSRAFQVVGTGQPLPAGWKRHVGTCLSPDRQLVWHVVEQQP
jgi:hypothetical protein